MQRLVEVSRVESYKNEVFRVGLLEDQGMAPAMPLEARKSSVFDSYQVGRQGKPPLLGLNDIVRHENSYSLLANLRF